MYVIAYRDMLIWPIPIVSDGCPSTSSTRASGSDANVLLEPLGRKFDRTSLDSGFPRTARTPHLA